MAIADIEVERASPLPTQRLVEFEELLHMPALGVMDAQVCHLGAIGCGQERLEVEILGFFSRALDDFIERAFGFLCGVLAPGKRPLGGGKASPARSELAGGQLGVLFVALFLVGHGHQQIKRGFQLDLLDEISVEVFAIGHEQRRLAGGIENDLGQLQQLRSRLGDATGGTGAGEANRLAGLGVQTEEGLGDLDGFEPRIVPETDHLAFAATVETVRIDGQESSGKVPAGPAQLAQGDLEPLGLIHGVRRQQIVDSLIGGDKGQAVDQFETFLTERAALAHSGDAQRGLMD